MLIQMSNHMSHHQEQAVSLAQSIEACRFLVATYLLIKKYVRIPPEEKEMLANFQANEAILIEIFGLEPASKEMTN